MKFFAIFILEIFIFVTFSESKPFSEWEDDDFCEQFADQLEDLIFEFTVEASTQTNVCLLYLENMKIQNQFTNEEKISKAMDFMELTKKSLNGAFTVMVLKVADVLEIDGDELAESLNKNDAGIDEYGCAYNEIKAAEVKAEEQLNAVVQQYIAEKFVTEA